MLRLLWQRLRCPRTAEEKSSLLVETGHLALYIYPACPYCHKVRLAITLLELKIQQRDAASTPLYRHELLREGGKTQVPCLKIGQDDGSNLWLYESDAIIEYLSRRFLREPSA
jgi:glutathione S-transferase